MYVTNCTNIHNCHKRQNIESIQGISKAINKRCYRWMYERTPSSLAALTKEPLVNYLN